MAATAPPPRWVQCRRVCGSFVLRENDGDGDEECGECKLVHDVLCRAFCVGTWEPAVHLGEPRAVSG